MYRLVVPMPLPVFQSLSTRPGNLIKAQKTLIFNSNIKHTPQYIWKDSSDTTFRPLMCLGWEKLEKTHCSVGLLEHNGTRIFKKQGKGKGPLKIFLYLEL